MVSLDLLAHIPLLEVLGEDQIKQLADAMESTTHKAGSAIIEQGGTPRHAFFILVSGEVKVSALSDGTEREFARFHGGELFGEMAVINKAKYAALCTAVSDSNVAHISIEKFESMFGSVAAVLRKVDYKTDPRKVISQFFEKGDHRGPRGSLHARNLEPDPATTSSWFAVFTRTGRDSIASMLSGKGVGKTCGVQGSASREGCLAGFVPFIQIHDNEHKLCIEVPPPDGRVTVFYRSEELRERAKLVLSSVIEEAGLDVAISDKGINLVDDCLPKHFGLDLAKALLHEAYIRRPDLAVVAGWATGLPSDPFLMNMNLHAVGNASLPAVVLLQHDEENCMNPNGLLLAHQEKSVTAMVEAFDVFTIGSTGMSYEALPEDQVAVAVWSLDQAVEISQKFDVKPWATRWQQVLQDAGRGDVYQKLCESECFGDPTFRGILADLVGTTAETRAVRGTAECCNFWCPSKLEDEYLVVGEVGDTKPWSYMTSSVLQEFLVARAKDGFVFPLNPIWLVQDASWSQTVRTLLEIDAMRSAMQCWFPPESHIIDKMVALKVEHSDGLTVVDKSGCA